MCVGWQVILSTTGGTLGISFGWSAPGSCQLMTFPGTRCCLLRQLCDLDPIMCGQAALCPTQLMHNLRLSVFAFVFIFLRLLGLDIKINVDMIFDMYIQTHQSI